MNIFDAIKTSKDNVLSFFAGVPVSTKKRKPGEALEIPISRETIEKIARPQPEVPQEPIGRALTFVKDIFTKIPARAALSYGQALAGVPVTTPGEIPGSKLSPIAQLAIYGKEPVKEFAGQETITKARGGELGALGSLGFAGLAFGADVTPFGGGGKNILKQIAKETSVEKIIPFVKNLIKGIADDEAEALARQLAKISDVKVVESTLKGFTPKATGAISKSKEAQETIERGFITSAKEAIPEAEKIAGQYIPRATDPLAIAAKNLIKDNLPAAEKLALTGTDDKAVATASELIKHYGDEAAKTTDEATKAAFYDKAAEIANTIAPKLTESGRTVQAASILGRLTPEGQVRFAAREIQRYNEFARMKIPELTGSQTRYITSEMKEIVQMAEGEAKAIRFQGLQNYIKDLVPTPLFQKIISVWKAGLLTGVKTSGLNIFANVSHAGGTEVAKDIPAAIVDKVISLFTRERTKTFTLRGVFSGAQEGIEKGFRYLRTGFDERNIGAKLDYRRINFGKGKLAKGLKAYTDTVFRILGSEDQPFYYAAKLRSLFDQAKAAAINKKLKGKVAQTFIDNLMRNPTDEMIRYATLDAETAVFQNVTSLSRAASGLRRAVPATEIIAPFTRTPSAVAMQILNYSPVGIISEVFKQIRRGMFDQRLFSQAMGRGVTGTGVLLLGAELYKKGMITGARPTSEKERELWNLEGKQPNSIKIDGKWRQVQVLGPVGNVLLIGGIFQKEFNESGSPTEAISNALAVSSQAFTQQTFLTGVSNFIDAISDPARSAEYVAGSTLASTIPTIISDVARATDTKERRATEIFERFQARIPGIREALEPQVSVLGEERLTAGNPLEIMIDPTRPSRAKDTIVIGELRRLWDLGFKVSPTLLGDKKGYSSLSKEQNTELWKRAGEITNEKLGSLFINEKYLKMSDDEKAKTVEDFVDKSKTNARAEVVIQVTKGLYGEPLKTELSKHKKSGLITKGVFKKYIELR